MVIIIIILKKYIDRTIQNDIYLINKVMNEIRDIKKMGLTL
jgi:hypothetical protein